MTTVIDSLVIELGLDPKKFTAGQKAAMEAFKKAQEEASSRAKLIESAGARAGQFFSKLRTEAIGFAALLIGGRGLKDFVSDTVTANANLGRMSKALGISSGELARWRTAAYLAGGSAESVSSAFETLVSEREKVQLHGSSEMNAVLNNLIGIGFTDAQGKLRSVTDLIEHVAVALRKMRPERAIEVGKIFGIDRDTVLFLTKTRGEVEKFLVTADKLNPITDKMVASGTHLQRTWRELETASEGWGNALLEDLSPSLETTGDWMTKLFHTSVELRNSFKKAPLFSGDWVDELKAKWKRTEPLFKRGDTFNERFGGASPNVKPGAGGGDISLGIAALMASLQNAVPGARFTALNDSYHAGTNSKHAKGLALDLTTTGDYAVVSAAIRNMLGPGATVINEDDPKQRSARSTGSHIHVQFNSPEDAARYARSAGPGGGTVNNRSNTSTSDVKVGAVNIYVPTAKEAAEVSRVWKAVDDAAFAAHANGGLNG